MWQPALACKKSTIILHALNQSVVTLFRTSSVLNEQRLADQRSSAGRLTCERTHVSHTATRGGKSTPCDTFTCTCSKVCSSILRVAEDARFPPAGAAVSSPPRHHFRNILSPSFPPQQWTRCGEGIALAVKIHIGTATILPCLTLFFTLGEPCCFPFRRANNNRPVRLSAARRASSRVPCRRRSRSTLRVAAAATITRTLLQQRPWCAAVSRVPCQRPPNGAVWPWAVYSRPWRSRRPLRPRLRSISAPWT